MSDNIRTALYGADYDVRLVSRASDAPPALARIVGKHCESGDIVVRDTWVSDDVAPGDLLGRRGHRRVLLCAVEPLQLDRPPGGGGGARRPLPLDPAPGDHGRSAEFGGDGRMTTETGDERPLDEKPIGVAVLGLGNVGSEVVRIIEDSAADLAARIGAALQLRGVGVRRVAADRGVPIELLTDDIDALVVAR